MLPSCVSATYSTGGLHARTHTLSHFLSFLDAIRMLVFGPQPVLANDMVLHRENMWPRNQKHKRNFMQDKTRQDNTRKDKTRRDETRQDKSSFCAHRGFLKDAAQVGRESRLADRISLAPIIRVVDNIIRPFPSLRRHPPRYKKTALLF
jgi:hypothetical protein